MVNTRRNQKYKLQQTFEFFSFDFILSKYFVRNLRYVLYTSVSYIQKIKNFFFLIRLLYFFRTLGIMALINLLYAVTLKNFLFLFLFFFTLLTLPLFSSPTTHTISSGRWHAVFPYFCCLQYTVRRWFSKHIFLIMFPSNLSCLFQIVCINLLFDAILFSTISLLTQSIVWICLKRPLYNLYFLLWAEKIHFYFNKADIANFKI